MDFKDIFALWPSLQTLAEQLHERIPDSTPERMKYRVQKWETRNSVPSPYWSQIVESAQELDLPVTLKMLAEASQLPPRKDRAA